MNVSQIRSVVSSMQQKLYSNHYTPRILSHKRWKNIIVMATQNLEYKYSQDKPLITDLHTIARAIPEEYLVEATIEINKFKPEFIEEKPLLENNTISTLSQSCVKAAKYISLEKKEDIFGFGKNTCVTQKTFTEEFSKNYHPIRFMIKNIRNLLQLKYKSLIDNNKVKLQKLQALLKNDVLICTQFLVYTSQPYKQLLDCSDNDQSEKLSEKFDKFFNSYLKNHPQILLTIHTILLYYSRYKYQNIVAQILPNISTPQEYHIPDQFLIDGCYIRSMTSLIEFSSYGVEKTPQKVLLKLFEFRKNILNDIDQYYLNKQGDTKQLELNAQIQIEIIRFIIGKLKGWVCEIFAQLKFLDYYYGDQSIAFKYQQASFMYVQLSMAFEIIGFQ